MNTEVKELIRVALRDIAISVEALGFNYVSIEATHSTVSDPDEINVRLFVASSQPSIDGDPDSDLWWPREERFTGGLSMSQG